MSELPIESAALAGEPPESNPPTLIGSGLDRPIELIAREQLKVIQQAGKSGIDIIGIDGEQEIVNDVQQS